MIDVAKELLSLQDQKYKEFVCKLMPTVDPNTVIGIRTPDMRAFAKKFAKSEDAQEFIKILPHKYYEENNIHGFVIEQIKDFDKAVEEVDRFLPYVDNWATCDLMSPKVFKKDLAKLEEKIYEWIKSDKTYTIRFGVEMLMSFYLDEHFKKKYLTAVSKIKSDEYYVNMMLAWFFATALAKQYDSTIGYLENKKLPVWVHNKTIRKAIESYRITDEQKAYLRTLAIKKK